MRVLVLPSFYPSSRRPFLGIFFRELTLAARSAGVDVGVAYAETRSLRQLAPRALMESHFQVKIEIEHGIPTVRQNGWNPLAQFRLGGEIWIRQMEFLARMFAARVGRPDLIHAHNALWAGVAARRVARTLGCRYVITEHSSAVLAGGLSGARRTELSSVYREAAAVICVSNALALAVKNVCEESTPIVIPNTVDTSFFTLPPTARSVVEFVFCAIGNLTANKAFDHVLQSFAFRFRGRTDVRLEIGGDGPERNSLAALAARLGVAGQVRFLGALNRSQVRDAMWRAHAFVLASDHETFGVVLVEALATGLPVIATRSGGPSDIVFAEVGYLVEPRDEVALASAMGRLCEVSRFEPTAMRSFATDRFGYAVVGTELARVYRGCLELRHRPS